MTNSNTATDIRILAADMADDHCNAVLGMGAEPAAADADDWEGIDDELRTALRRAIGEWVADREDSLLADAIAYLDAEESLGWTYRDDATGLRYRAFRNDMLALGRLLERRVPDAYSVWCSNTVGELA